MIFVKNKIAAVQKKTVTVVVDQCLIYDIIFVYTSV